MDSIDHNESSIRQMHTSPKESFGVVKTLGRYSGLATAKKDTDYISYFCWSLNKLHWVFGRRDFHVVYLSVVLRPRESSARVMRFSRRRGESLQSKWPRLSRHFRHSSRDHAQSGERRFQGASVDRQLGRFCVENQGNDSLGA